MQEVKFGTDGIRDVVNKGLTSLVAYDTGCALALYLKENTTKPFVIIGHDTRQSAHMLLSAFVSGLMSYGAEVLCMGLVTTPAISYLTAKLKADAGVMITASHNPHEYNGIKIFNSRGEKIGMQSTNMLEKYAKHLDKYELSAPDDIGRISNNKRAINSYIKFLKSKIKFNNIKVALDCANGATNIVAPKVFSNENVTIIGDSTVSCMVNKNSGVMDTKRLQTLVIRDGYDVGFAFDGDGDRIYAVDEKGRVFDGDDILAVIALYLKDKGKLPKNTIVGTVMTNYGIEASLKLFGINLVRQHVGDRFVHSEMKKFGYAIGGEQSGHVILKDSLSCSDGILIAITLLNIMSETHKSFSELVSVLKRYPSELIGVDVSEENKNYILSSLDLQEFINSLEQELGYRGRILVRASGTENKIRILVEGDDKKLIKSIAESIKYKILSMQQL